MGQQEMMTCRPYDLGPLLVEGLRKSLAVSEPLDGLVPLHVRTERDEEFHEDDAQTVDVALLIKSSVNISRVKLQLKCVKNVPWHRIPGC